MSEQQSSTAKTEHPVRNIIVYADGRVCEVPFRLCGNYYLHTEEDGLQRMFRAGYAHGAEGSPFTMVYTEEAGGPELKRLLDEGPLAIVNGAPVPVDAGVVGEDARDIHARCARDGGHKLSYVCGDKCERCGLDGRLIRMFDREGNLRDVSDLRDRVVRFYDENRDLKVENAELRREIERVKKARNGR